MTRELSLGSLPERNAARLVRWMTTLLLILAFQMIVRAQVLTSFVDASGRHGIYSGNDFHVHQLFCGAACDNVANWVNQDLTAMSGAPPVSNYNSYASFTDGTGEHVFFLDQAQHVHQLRFASGAWGNSDLGAVAYGGLSGYSANGVSRLFYETSAQHIHMLVSSNGSSWSDADLTSNTGAGLAAWFGALTSFNDGSGEHVFYVATNGHINQMYGYYTYYYICSPFGCHFVYLFRWVNQDLTAAASGPLALSAPISGYSDSFGEHVLYETSNEHLHQLVYASGRWSDSDLTVTSNGPLMDAGLSSFADGFGEQAFYIAFSLHILQPWNGVTGDLTTFANAPLVGSCGGVSVTAFGESVNGVTFEDVFYVAMDGNLHRITMQPGVSASDQNLTGGQGFGSIPRNFCIQ